MSTMCVVIRATTESSLDDCIKSVKEKKIPYFLIHNSESLENKAKETIKIASENSDKYDWVMALDADIILTMSKKDIEAYCTEMENPGHYNPKYQDIFCFTGYATCTKRGLVCAINFYRTRYCGIIYDKIKEIDFSFHKGREEYEIKKYVKDYWGLDWQRGYKQLSFGIHFFEINNKNT